MTEEQFTESVGGLKRAKRAANPYYWWFTSKGADGDPILLVGKREAPLRKEGREARKTSKDKRFALGRLKADETGKLNFSIDEGAAKPKQVQRSFKTVVAKLGGFKRVKGLLQQAIILDGATFDARFASIAGPESQGEGGEVANSKRTSDPLKLKHELAKVMDRARASFISAKERTGGTGSEFEELKARQLDTAAATAAANDAFKRQQAGTPVDEIHELFMAAIDAWDELSDAALAVGLADDEGQADAVVDVAALNETWLRAYDTVQAQLNNLATAMRKENDEELREIADKGLAKIAKNQRVKFQAAMLDATRAPSDPKLIAALGDAADDFLAFLGQSDQVQAVDENEAGVTVTMRTTLSDALNRIANAI